MAGSAAGDPPPQHVLELYRLTVEMADRVSARRAGTNTYFLTLQSGMTLVLGFIARHESGAEAPDRFIVALAVSAGIVLTIAWWLLLRSYRDLNKAKFAVITRIEEEYFDLKPFKDEWESLRSDPVRGLKGRYAELGAIERLVPVAFALLYVLVGLRLAGIRVCLS